MRRITLPKNVEENLKSFQDYMLRMADTAGRILGGETETDACKANNVCKNSFRSAIRRQRLPYGAKKPENSLGDIKAFHPLERLYADVMELDANTMSLLEIPPDLEDTYGSVKHLLTPSEQDMLHQYYWEAKAQAQIGREHGMSKSRANQVYHSAIGKLRKPCTKHILAYGREALEEQKRQREAIAKAKISGMLETSWEEFKKMAKETPETYVIDSNLSNRAKRVLMENGVLSAKGFLNYTSQEIKNLPGVGPGTYREIMAFVAENAIALKTPDTKQKNGKHW